MSDNPNAIVLKDNNSIQLGSLMATNPHDVIKLATAVATELKKIITEKKLAKLIQQREYVYVDGWTTMGAMLGVTAREVVGQTKELDNGDWEATVELCRVSDGAKVGCGSAIVGVDEVDRSGRPTWGSRPKYARRSMAVTRATGKAFRISFSWIMSLAGYATTPAEEMDGIFDGEYQEVKKAPVKAPPAPQADRPYSPDALVERLQVMADSFSGKTCTDNDRTSVRINLSDMAGGEPQYHDLLNYLVGVAHIAEVSPEMILALKKWIHVTKQPDDTWIADEMAVREAKSAYVEALKSAGQQTLPLE
jgi:hypothetical protein